MPKAACGLKLQVLNQRDPPRECVLELLYSRCVLGPAPWTVEGHPVHKLSTPSALSKGGIGLALHAACHEKQVALTLLGKEVAQLWV